MRSKRKIYEQEEPAAYAAPPPSSAHATPCWRADTLPAAKSARRWARAAVCCEMIQESREHGMQARQRARSETARA